MPESIITISHRFFDEIVKPILASQFPDALEEAAIGIFGYGSEALGLDDEYSSDHHWGLRVDAIFPHDIFVAQAKEIQEVVSTNLPASYAGHSLREAHVAGSGLAPESLEGFLTRTVGIDHAPESYADWLSVPEEDITHVINGEIWHDPGGRFSAIRDAYNEYYPEPVRRRRIAHWCRYFSGMGTYALKRAILRNNEYYANITFTRALRLGVQLAFLLDRRYFPYDKWTYTYFARLPRLAGPLTPIVDEAVKLSTSWDRKLELLHAMADILDATMVEEGIIKPHPKFVESTTSGYRLLEHAYAEIIQGLPAEIKTVVPVWEQVYFEEFHSGFVDGIDMDVWDNVLQLKTDSTTT